MKITLLAISLFIISCDPPTPWNVTYVEDTSVDVLDAAVEDIVDVADAGEYAHYVKPVIDVYPVDSGAYVPVFVPVPFEEDSGVADTGVDDACGLDSGNCRRDCVDVFQICRSLCPAGHDRSECQRNCNHEKHECFDDC